MSEARLGLAPAVIAPYVIAAVGQRQARRLFLTAARIDAHEALRLGLVHRVVPAEHLDEAVEAEVGYLLAGGPEALAHCKRISLGNLPQDPERTGSAELLTRLWVSTEAREGLSAFLEKRRPRWGDEPGGDQLKPALSSLTGARCLRQCPSRRSGGSGRSGGVRTGCTLGR